MSDQLIQYEWTFLSPRTTFDFLLALEGPVAAKTAIYVVEGLNDDGSSDPNVSFDWLHSRGLERYFLYAEERAAGGACLRQLHAERPVGGIRLTVNPWGDDAQEDVLAKHAACWLWWAPDQGRPEISVITRGNRTEVAP